jgi:threonine aldolase
MWIDFLSDTVAKPTPAMLEAMWSAEVGDDVFGEDPTVNALEMRLAQLFGMEAGLFCPSGTMTNQVAISVHVQAGEEVICADNAHIYLYEGGGIMANARASVQLLPADRGRISAQQVAEAIQPDNIHHPVTRLVCLENTSNKGGGACYTVEQLAAIQEVCQRHNLVLHLDGARVFNALIAKQMSAVQMGSFFDTISVCLSKGLGCPVGSVLLGSKSFIQKARRIRKRFGGGWRQAGYLAAAGLFALDHHIERLADDHRRAQRVAESLSQCQAVTDILPVETNIVIATLQQDLPPDRFVQKLAEKQIRAAVFGKNQVRFVTHLDLTEEHIQTFQHRIQTVI